MKLCGTRKSLFIEIDASGIGLGTGLLQVRDGMKCTHDDTLDNTLLQQIDFASKSLSSAEQCYSNIEQEALGILHKLGKFNHHCFVTEISIISDHNLLVSVFKRMWK